MVILPQSRPELFTLQHKLYIYLNQASNLASTMQSGGTVSQSAVKSYGLADCNAYQENEAQLRREAENVALAESGN